MGVRKQTCNEFIYVELGIATLKSIITKRQYRFYKKIISERDWPMLRHIVCQSRDTKTNFIKHYDRLLQQYTSEDDIISEATEKIKSDITDKANNGRSKYCAYLELNPMMERCQIYDKTVPTSKLQKVTQIRTISHSLEIEMGRHGRNRKLPEERLCHCGQIETEKHFLLICTSYIHIRQKYESTDEYTMSSIFEKSDIAEYISELYNIRLLYK